MESKRRTLSKRVSPTEKHSASSPFPLGSICPKFRSTIYSGAKNNSLDTKIGQLFVVDSFFIVREFLRPSKMVCNLGLPVIVDKNVKGADISHFFFNRMEGVCCLEDSEGQVPQLRVLEILFLLASIIDFILQKEKIVVISYLYGITCTVQRPFEPHSCVPLKLQERGSNKASQDK